MQVFKNKVFKFIMLLLFNAIGFGVNAQLTGQFTINPTKPADSANYQNFESVVSDLKFGVRGDGGAKNGPSVGHDLHFKVYDTIYHTNALNFDSIDGVFTFTSMSGDSSKCMLIRPSSSIADSNYVMRIANCGVLRFNGIGFKRSGSKKYGQVIRVENSTFSFYNCQFIGTKVSYNNAHANTIVTRNTWAWCDWNNCLIKGGTSNLVDSSGDFNFIQGCVFDSAYNNSLHSIGGRMNRIVGNTFTGIRQSLAANASIKIENAICYTEFIFSPGISQNYFAKNKAKNTIWLSNNYNQSRNSPYNPWNMIRHTTCRIFNNKIAATNGTGIRINNCDSLYIYNNNILLNGGDSSNCGIHTVSATDTITKLFLANNNIYQTSGRVYDLAKAAHVFESSHNNLLSKYKHQFRCHSRNYSVLDSFKSKTGLDSFSIAVNPSFKTSIDLTRQNMSLDGVGKMKYANYHDFNGNFRNGLYMDVGADELGIPKLDATIEPLWSLGEVCSGKQDLKLVLKNLGTDTLKKAEILSNFNGSLLIYPITYRIKHLDTTFIWTGSLATGQADTIFLGSTNYIEKYWVHNYNRISKINDTIDEFDFNNYLAGIQIVAQSITVNAGIDKELCINDDSIILSPDSGYNKNYTYSWHNLAHKALSTDTFFKVNPLTSSFYVLKALDSFKRCSSYDTVQIKVNPKPNPIIAGLDTLCHLDTVTYKAIGAKGSKFTWSLKNASETKKSGLNDSLISIVLDSAGISTLSLVTRNTHGCTDSTMKTIVASELPKVDFSYDLPCTNQPIHLTDKSTNSYLQTWNFEKDTVLTGSKVSHIITDTAEYEVVLKVESREGCKSQTTKKLFVNATPKVYFEMDSIVCANNELNIYNVLADSGVVTWKFGNGDTSPTLLPNYTFQTSGIYDVQLSADNNGCKDSFLKQVVVDNLPNSNFNYYFDGAKVKAYAVDASSLSYKWNFGDSTYLFGDTVRYNYSLVQGWVFISLTVTNANGCQSTVVDSAYINATSINSGVLKNEGNLIKIYPNPIASKAIVELELKEKSSLLVDVYDLQGRHLETIFKGQGQKGNSKIELRSFDRFETGTYLLRVIINNNFRYVEMIQIE
ncbi:MAG: T9SS type A sorting domain-containing protein [Bacteroidia bacterium]